MAKKSPKQIVSIIFKAVALAMGVAVIAFCVFGVSGVNNTLLLGIGLACAGLSLLEN